MIEPIPDLVEPRILNQTHVFEEVIDYLGRPPVAIKLAAWPLFNQLVGGFRMREFSIICGPTGCGKTTWLANVSAQLVCQKIKHFVMSIETGHLDYMARVVSVWEEKDLNTGDPIDPNELARVTAKHMQKIQNGMIEFSLYESRLSVEQLKYEINHAVQLLGCKIVFIDNLNYILKVTRAQDAVVEMDRVVHELIEFVKQIDVHIVMVMHPRKTENGRVVSEFDIKGSSTSVQEAQNVFLFNRPEPDRIKSGELEPFNRELFLAKMRRRGAHAGKSIVFRNTNTSYSEQGYR